jgi:hypothetical protein
LLRDIETSSQTGSRAGALLHHAELDDGGATATAKDRIHLLSYSL